jgi:hypothetical protein
MFTLCERAYSRFSQYASILRLYMRFVKFPLFIIQLCIRSIWVDVYIVQRLTISLMQRIGYVYTTDLW